MMWTGVSAWVDYALHSVDCPATLVSCYILIYISCFLQAISLKSCGKVTLEACSISVMTFLRIAIKVEGFGFGHRVLYDGECAGFGHRGFCIKQDPGPEHGLSVAGHK